MITLPWNLGGKIRDCITAYRKEHNIPVPEKVKKLGFHRIRDTFFEDELELVNHIELDNEILAYIDLFPNVTSISITGKDQFESYDIKSIIEKYPNLEKIVIKGQKNLETLDVSKFKKLKHLELISNNRLHKVVGLDQVENLSQLTFYDNITYQKEEELCEIASKLSIDGAKCNLDVLYMPTMQKKGIYNPDAIEWCESAGLGPLGDELKYNTKELEEAVKKAREIVSTYTKPTDTAKQKFAILYQWMCENVKYDHEAQQNNHIHTKNGRLVGKKGGTNGTVNGLIYGSCVCEGYSKIMQMLLKICEISSYDIACFTEEIKESPKYTLHDGSETKKESVRMHIGNHSIIKVNLDGWVYYSDVTWDAYRFQNNYARKYFLLSGRDISLDHKLTGEDGVMTYKSISTEEFNQLMIFAQNRIRSVSKELIEKENQHKAIINQIERLLGIEINPIDIFVYDNELKVYKAVHKDVLTLSKEQEIISSQLRELCYKGKLDLKKYIFMNIALIKEYERMKEKALEHDFNFEQEQRKKEAQAGIESILKSNQAYPDEQLKENNRRHK